MLYIYIWHWNLKFLLHQHLISEKQTHGLRVNSSSTASPWRSNLTVMWWRGEVVTWWWGDVVTACLDSCSSVHTSVQFHYLRSLLLMLFGPYAPPFWQLRMLCTSTFPASLGSKKITIETADALICHPHQSAAWWIHSLANLRHCHMQRPVLLVRRRKTTGDVVTWWCCDWFSSWLFFLWITEFRFLNFPW